MKRFLIFLIACISFGCVNKEVHVPDDLIPADSFIEIMIDLQIREGMGSSANRQQTELALQNEMPEDFLKIMNKHNTDADEFLKTFDFYSNHPQLMEGIYEQVLDSLSKLEAEIKQKFTKEERYLNDSLQKLNQRRHDSIRGIHRSVRIDKK